MASCSGLIVSYDRPSGERLWVYDVKSDGAAQSFHGEMARQEGSIFIAPDPYGGHVYRLDEKTGSVQWKWPSETGVSSDLLAVEDHIVAVTTDNRLSVLDARSGELLWQTEAVEGQRVAPVTPTPVIVDGDIIFGRADGHVTRRNLADGTQIWEQQLPGGVTTDLVLFDDTVILGTMDGTVVRIDPHGLILGQTQLETIPAYRWMVVGEDRLIGLTNVDGPNRLLVALDPRTLELIWSRTSPDEEGWTTAQPALAWDALLVGNREPALYAYDPETGDLLWRAGTDHSPRTVCVDGRDLFVGTFDGTLHAYRRP